MLAMMHLRNFYQVSIEEVRQEMTGSAVKGSALDRNSERRRLKIGLELRTPCEKFLATPLTTPIICYETYSQLFHNF